MNWIKQALADYAVHLRRNLAIDFCLGFCGWLLFKYLGWM